MTWFANASCAAARSVNCTEAVVFAPCGAVYSIEIVLPTATPGIVTTPPDARCATGVPSTKIAALSSVQPETVTVATGTPPLKATGASASSSVTSVAAPVSVWPVMLFAEAVTV